jgi:lipoprotein-releasing system ATP-binding protein
MIEARGITKSYGDVAVLKGIDLEIANAEVVTIVGRSGAGKTTLLQILGSLARPDTGSIYIGGEEISRLPEAKLAKFRNENIGFVFQSHQLLPEFTALENVCIPAYIAGRTSRRKAESRANELLDFLGMSHRTGHKPSQLSGGEQQRVAVARSLMNSPKVIFADEPSGNLDTLNKEDLHNLFFSLRDNYKQTFVIVTHDMNLAQMADRTIQMSDGKITSF